MRFVGQPFEDYPNLVDFVEQARIDGFDELKIAVAWAKRSGLGRIWDSLVQFREQGGEITLIVGVSEGGATREGLELALDIADHAYVFHDPKRTFHPKVYFASAPGKRSLMVGSSNLTAGGLSWNYEASMWMEWDDGENDAIDDDVERWFADLIAAEGSCTALTEQLIDQLEQSDDILLGSERRARRVQNRKSDTPEDNDSLVGATIGGLFKPIIAGLHKLPGMSSLFAPSKPLPFVGSGLPLVPVGLAQPEQSPNFTAAPPISTANIKRRWFKKLDNTAAQQVKSPKSNATGNLRLSQETAAIDHTTYFRNDFFGGLPWTPTEGKDYEQEVVVDFRTWLDGEDLGLQSLRISHDPGRIANQGNVPTVLHWGGLAKMLRVTSYVGLYVNLERDHAGMFNLIISKVPRGDFRI